MAVREGFEPSMRLQTTYSLSRGAPSASRPPHRIIHIQLIHISKLKEYGASWRIRTSDRLVRSQVLYPAELRTHILFFIWMLTQMSKNGGEGGIRTLDAATNHILP